MSSWWDLMRDFDLEEKVKKFVMDNVVQLLGANKHTFSFDGTNHTHVCRNQRPHIPHVTGWYDTVRYGRLEHFCVGKSGDNPGDPVIVVTDSTQSWVRGYWFIREGKKA